MRIKRFIRDYLYEQKNGKSERLFEIYLLNDISEASGRISGSAARMKSLKKKYENDASIKTDNNIDASKLLKKCIDVRLFGGISTEEKDAVDLTGPVQFALLNPSLNNVELRMHQNTSVFVSSTEKSRGAIGTTTIVPYAINQIHGWINPFSAQYTNLTNDDISIMFKALWDSINNSNTRTKSNQNSILLLKINYSGQNKKLYGLDHLIKIKTKDKKEEQIRSINDYDFEFADLVDKTNCDAIESIHYYTELEAIDDILNDKPKFRKMSLTEFILNGEVKK